MPSLPFKLPPISLGRSSWRLRYWSLKQVGLDLLYQPPDAVRSAVSDEFWTLLTGHLNGRFFHSAGLEYPELRQMGANCLDDTQEMDFLMIVAETILLALEELGQEKSGFLRGYLQEARRNLVDCPVCSRLVGECLYEEGRLAVALDSLRSAIKAALR